MEVEVSVKVDTAAATVTEPEDIHCNCMRIEKDRTYDAPLIFVAGDSGSVFAPQTLLEQKMSRLNNYCYCTLKCIL